MSMEVPGLSLEDKLRYLKDAKDELKVATAKKNRWQEWASQELQEKLGETLPITGFVSSVSVKMGESWTTVTAGNIKDGSSGWWLPPYNYTICDAGNGSVRVSYPGHEEKRRFVVGIDSLSLVTPEQIAETEALWEQQRQEVDATSR